MKRIFKKREKRKMANQEAITNLPLTFDIIINPLDMEDDDNVKLFLILQKNKLIKEWKFGKRGDYISSSFITKDGTLDLLTSPRKNDENYSNLLKVHYRRAMHLVVNCL